MGSTRVFQNALDSTHSPQTEAHEQQMQHLAQAHAQALTTRIQGHLPHKLEAEDALTYLEEVKQKFASNPSYFHEFMNIMKECKSNNVDVIAVIGRVFNLFQGYPELIKGFGIFLPPSYNLLLQTSSKYFTEAFARQSCSTSDSHTVEEPQGDERQKAARQLFSAGRHSESADSSGSSNFAFSFINKVKDRFQEDSVEYKSFMKILNSYLTHQEKLKDKPDSTREDEVYCQVAKLFVNHNDLIQEFKKFVPQAKHPAIPKVPPLSDPSIASVGKNGSLKELMFFDKVRKALNYPEVYDNFLRCLMLFNEDVVSRLEAVQLVSSFLGKFPELLKEFKDLLGLKESGVNVDHVLQKIIDMNKEKRDPDLAMDVDYSTVRRHGASYRALPKSYEQPKCSGRTALCREVLNDIWVSFPSWSEDSTFVSSCKTQYEEIIYRCEDERFELDMVIEANASTIQILDGVMKRINKMTQEEKNAFILDDTLGGSSTVHQIKAIRRAYGDRADEIIENLKNSPALNIPIVLKKLKSKEEEWKEAQNNFNAIWREQYESYYLKSLDHQGINFKQNDSKCLRSKSLINEIETLYEERREQIEEGSAGGSSSPHMVLECGDLSVLEDANNLISLHTKRQAGIHREDRQRIEHLIRHFVPDFLGVPRSIVIDDDTDQEDSQLDDSMTTGSETKSGETTPQEPSSPAEDVESDSEDPIFHLNPESCLKVTERKPPFVKENSNNIALAQELQTDLPYALFFVNNNWYLFLRQLHIFLDRLSKLHTQSSALDMKKSAENTAPESSAEVTMTNTPSRYTQLLDKICSVLNGTLENGQFEDDARDLFGIHAYVSFTMDKVVHNIVRQLQQIISDDTCRRCTTFYTQYVKELAAYSPLSPWDLAVFESQYQKKVEQLLCDENCYKIIWYKKEQLLTVELLDSEVETCDEPCEVERWSDYVDNFCDADWTSDGMKSPTGSSPVFLMRNLRKQQKLWKGKLEIKHHLLSHSFFPSSPSGSSSSYQFIAQKRKSPSTEDLSNEQERDRATSSAALTESSDSQGTEIELKSKRRKQLFSFQNSSVKSDKSAAPERSTCRGNSRSLGEGESKTKKVSIENRCLNTNKKQSAEFVSKDRRKRALGLDEIDSSGISDSMSDENSPELTKGISRRLKFRGRSSRLLGRVLGNAGAKTGAANSCDMKKSGAVGSNVTPGSSELKNSDSERVEPLGTTDKPVAGCSKVKVPEHGEENSSSSSSRTDPLSKTLSKATCEESSADSSEAAEQPVVQNKDQALSSSECDEPCSESDSEAEECLQLATNSMVIHEDTQCRFSGNSYKITFVGHLGSFMYRRKSLRRARRTHRRISKNLGFRFRAWHKVWLDRYVTPSMMKFCQDWLLRSEWCNAGIVCITENEPDKPPYGPFSRYRIQFYKDSD